MAKTGWQAILTVQEKGQKMNDTVVSCFFVELGHPEFPEGILLPLKRAQFYIDTLNAFWNGTPCWQHAIPKQYDFTPLDAELMRRALGVLWTIELHNGRSHES